MFVEDYNYLTYDDADTISGSITDQADSDFNTLSGTLNDEIDGLADVDHNHDDAAVDTKFINLYDPVSVSGGYESGDYIDWSSHDIYNETIFSHTISGAIITVSASGIYDVTYNIDFENLSGSSIDFSLNIDSSDHTLDYGKTYGYNVGITDVYFSMRRKTIYQFSDSDSFALEFVVASGTGWYDDDWDHRKKIIIDNTSVSGPSNLTDFPFLFNTTDDDFKSIAYDGHVKKTNGGDILFTSADGTTKLKHEIESYTDSTGEVIAWIKIPTLKYNEDTEIYIYYGHAAVEDQEDPTNVWDSNYIGVFHLAEDPSGVAPQMIDSTSNTSSGTSFGTMTSGDQVTGQIDGSLDFDGIDDGIDANGIATNWDEDLGTVELWMNRTFANGDSNSYVLLNCQVDESNRFRFEWEGVTTQWRVAHEGQGTAIDKFMVDTSIPQNTLTQVAMTWDVSGDELAGFVNGSEIGAPATGIASPDAFDIFTFGNRVSHLESFPGIIDELRISNIVRSDDWIATSYNSQNSPATFYSVEAQSARIINVSVKNSSSLYCKLLREL